MQNLPTSIQWQFSRFADLQPQALYAILQARSAVFVVEQKCVFLDMDGLDPQCMHLAAWNQEQQLLAYLRVVSPGVAFKEASLGRVISTSLGRGTGIGKQLFAHGIAHAQTLYPQQAIRIGAQQYLEKFYASFGFETVSATYLEDDIPHVEMLLAPAQK